MKKAIDEYGDEYYWKNIILKLRCESYSKKNLEGIEKTIMEILNDKAFDGYCWFEVIE
ncbi:MAG: hypothetical protein ACI39B_08045 [Methanobrevibacter smithii]|jgi:hypothetical protein